MRAITKHKFIVSAIWIVSAMLAGGIFVIHETIRESRLKIEQTHQPAIFYQQDNHLYKYTVEVKGVQKPLIIYVTAGNIDLATIMVKGEIRSIKFHPQLSSNTQSYIKRIEIFDLVGGRGKYLCRIRVYSEGYFTPVSYYIIGNSVGDCVGILRKRILNKLKDHIIGEVNVLAATGKLASIWGGKYDLLIGGQK